MKYVQYLHYFTISLTFQVEVRPIESLFLFYFSILKHIYKRIYNTITLLAFYNRDPRYTIIQSYSRDRMSLSKGGIVKVLLFYILFAIFILFNINRLTNSLCMQKEIPEEKQSSVFRTINILVTILLISSYVKILVAIT